MFCPQRPYWQVGGELWEFSGRGFHRGIWKGSGNHSGRGKEWVRDFPLQALLFPREDFHRAPHFNRGSPQKTPVPVLWNARGGLLRSWRATSLFCSKLGPRPPLWGRHTKPLSEKFTGNQRISHVWTTSRPNQVRSLDATMACILCVSVWVTPAGSTTVRLGQKSFLCHLPILLALEKVTPAPNSWLS